MRLYTGRVAWAYCAIVAGAVLFLLRRLLLPSFAEVEGLPFEIAVGSALNSCYGRPALNTCGDGIIFVLATLGVIIASGWGSFGRSVFAVILAILPLGLFFAFAPIWIPPLLLLLIPLAIEGGTRLLFPRVE
ncbi:MAG: hypothetical protein OHK0015_44610 [Chloroflexi bacterium OHK40]